MSEGELLQIEKTRNLNLSEEVYYDIIRKKTASLIASCCAIGAASSGANEEQIEQMRLFGEKIGIAFQMKDDLMDYGDEDIGKPKGIDLKEKKLTLPIIYTLNQAEPSVRKRIINTIKNHHTDKKKVAEVIDYVNAHDGIAYTKKAMGKYVSEALAIIDTLPENPYKSNVKELVNYIIDRHH
jgi:octaprenyl-diphosphate synthase